MNNAQPLLSKKQTYPVFIIAALSILMAGIDSTIVSVGLPAMMTDLHTNVALIGWTLTGYLLAQAIVMPVIGKLSDDLGRKKLFLGAVLIFTASSLAVALSPNVVYAIVFRVIQGIAGGAFLPLSTGIVSDTFGDRRMTAIGLFSSIYNVGGLIGPNVGGFLIDSLSWHWIFLINVPIGAALFLFGLNVLPRDSARVSFSRADIDLWGLGLFVTGILCLLFGITDLAANTRSAGILTLVLFIASVILFIFFVRHEDRVPNPMIDTKLLRWKPFFAVNLYNLIFGAAMLGAASFVPYYTIVSYNMTASQSGLIITPRSLAVVIVSAVTSFFIIRLRYRKPMIIGVITIGISTLLMGLDYSTLNFFGLSTGDHIMLTLSLLSLASGVGFGIANPAANNAVIDLVPGKTAAVAGIRGMFRFLGGVLGTAVITLTLSLVSDQAAGMRAIFVVFGVLLLLLIPVVFMIPDMAVRTRKDRDLI
jgi:EmrB/QacA subfamily drug resistance transporter